MVSLCFSNLFRPSIKHLHVKIYENGKEKNFESFDSFRHDALCRAIDSILTVDKNSPYWFETDIYEHSSCFRPAKVTIEVACYAADKYNPTAKKSVQIPPRYRKKLFDKYHVIHPEQFSSIIWPKQIEVKFVVPEKNA